MEMDCEENVKLKEGWKTAVTTCSVRFWSHIQWDMAGPSLYGPPAIGHGTEFCLSGRYAYGTARSFARLIVDGSQSDRS